MNKLTTDEYTQYTQYVQSLKPGDEVWLKHDATSHSPAQVGKARVTKLFKHVVRIGRASFALKRRGDLAIGQEVAWNGRKIILPAEAEKFLEETKEWRRPTEQRSAFAERARKIRDRLPGYRPNVNTKADMQAVVDNLREAADAFEALMRDTPDEVWRE